MKKMTKKSRTVMIILLIIWIEAVAAVLYFSLSEPVNGSERKLPVYCTETDEKEMALTFNCAWTDEGLDELLEILDGYNAKCTFFIVGDFAEKYPEAVRKIYNAGHETGNHSLKHNDPVQQSYADIVSDISANNDLLFSVTGKSPVLYRAPSGSYDNKTVEAAESLGMKAIQWNVDSVDWKNPAPDEICRRVLKKADCGSIVLFHVGKRNTLDAIGDILKDLSEKDFRFVTVSSLISDKNGYIDFSGKLHKNVG